MQISDGVNVFWSVLLSVGGIFGVWNMWRAFNPVEPEIVDEYRKIIVEKDKIIKEYEIKLEVCLRLNNHDKRETLE